MFPARILTRLVSRQYLCSFDRKKVDFDFTKDFVKLLKTFVGKLRQIEPKTHIFFSKKWLNSYFWPDAATI